MPSPGWPFPESWRQSLPGRYRVVRASRLAPY
jgi:hypothetical protein